MNNELFQEVIGQSETKKKLKFYLESYHRTMLMPNLLFSGGRGCGKTMFSQKVGEQLVEFKDKKPVMKLDGATPKKKSWIPLNAASIPNFRWFAEKVLVPYCVGKPSTVFIDECSELKEDVAMNLLSLLNPNIYNRNSLVVDEMPIDIDFKLNTFIFATTNVEKMPEPLQDRLTRIDLEPYTVSDLAKVVQKSASDISFLDNVLDDIAAVVRGNCRQAVKIASEIKSHLGDNKKFDKAQWEEFKKALSIHKLGLSRMEIDILRILRDKPEGSSLTNLSAKTGIHRAALQRDYELFLQRHSLLDIRQNGRVITSKGIEYLKELETCQA